MKCDTTNGQEAKRVSGFDKRETIVILPISHKRRLRVGDAVLIWPELVMRFMGWLRPSDKVDWRGKTGLVLADAGRPGWFWQNGLARTRWIGAGRLHWISI